jgi:curved DNA-binding protein CbpA
MKNFIDYYAILGIPATATAAKMRSRYRLLAKRHHPDTADGDKAAASEKFRLIKEAYELLGDADRRARYDHERRQHMRSGTTAENRATRSVGKEPGMAAQAWKRACRDNPDLERICDHLAQLSPSLVRDFREALLRSNDYVQATAIATKLKADFLTRYLDHAPQLLNFPDWLRKRF